MGGLERLFANVLRKTIDGWQPMLQQVYHGRSDAFPLVRGVIQNSNPDELRQAAIFATSSPTVASGYANRAVGNLGGAPTVDRLLIDPLETYNYLLATPGKGQPVTRAFAIQQPEQALLTTPTGVEQFKRGGLAQLGV